MKAEIKESIVLNRNTRVYEVTTDKYYPDIRLGNRIVVNESILPKELDVILFKNHNGAFEFIDYENLSSKSQNKEFVGVIEAIYFPHASCAPTATHTI
ncbi:hypothetical protein [Thiomicrorhabdus cannonii]|uniref:hypothetical protein n=1 Tax=Thiomicrorhabdus cannonii TaxID=2748011 RepID=UPI0015B88437|nr:hypothetical protein [Thiomicrorhabdus cannonii]